MARSKSRAPNLKTEDLSLGQRLAQIRKDRGLTQVELAAKMDSIQALISDYERDKLRPHPDILINFAKALQVSVDEILGLQPVKLSPASASANRRFLRRIQAIDKLPRRDQDALLRTIDAFLAARQAS